MKRKYDIDYLLRYVPSDTFEKIRLEKNDYELELLEDNFIDVDLNIKFLIKYGISNISDVILKNTDELMIGHDEFIQKIRDYEKRLSKEEVIMLIENM